MLSLPACSHCWMACPKGQDPESFSATAAALTIHPDESQQHVGEAWSWTCRLTAQA